MILPRTQARLVAEGKASLAILPVNEYQPRNAKFRTHTRLAAEVVWIRGEWRDESSTLRRTDVLCQVRIVEHERRFLHEVTLGDARRAGFETRGLLGQWWRERYERVAAPASEDPWPDARPVEVRTIGLTLDVPVWMAQSGSGYTTRPGLAVIDAGECVPEDYRRWLGDEARAHDELRHLRSQRSDQAQRLAELYAESEEQGVDVSRQAASIQRQLDAMDRKLRRRAA